MPNVFFKKGTQSGFNAIGAGNFTPGAFYLTTDTQRLYYADSTAGAHQINPGITTVANIASLPKSNQISSADYGQFYYCIAENVLAIFNNGNWVQINSYEDTVVDTRTVTASKNNNTVSIVDVLYQSDTTKGGGRITANYEFTGANGLLANVTPKYVAADKFHSGIQYYTKSGDTYTLATVNSANFQAGVYYIQAGYAITLTAPTYTLSGAVTGAEGAKEAVITLGGATENNTVTIAAGNNTSISNENGKIVINSSDGDTLAAVTGSNEASGFGVTVRMGSGASQKGTIDPVIKLDSSVAESASGYKFANGTLSLPVYSKSEVDKKINDFNAMEYKSTISPAGATAKLASTTEKNGYVYMISEEGNLVIDNEASRKILPAGSTGKTITVTPGDLIVVQGAETNGAVVNPTLIHVPSGNDHDTTYTFTKVEHGITVQDDQGGSKSGLQLAAKDDLITLTDSDDASTGARVVTVEHKKVTQTSTDLNAVTQEAEGNLEFTIATPIVDGAGHVTGVQNKKYTVVDTHATVTNAINVSVTENAAKVESVVTVDGGDKKADFTLKSESLTVTASEKNISLNLEWGSF